MANKIAPRMERRGGGGINRLAEIVEPAMTVGSNILAEIPAWAAGMTELNQTGLPSEGMRRLEEVSEMLTYSPRTMEGQAGLQSLTDAVMKRMDALGVDEAIKYLNNTIVPNLQKTFGEEGAREIGSSVMMALPFVRKVPSMKAFHGSPHDFDEFSLDAIGTGEGAQAYGRGLYFAEAEDVARGYRDDLSKPIVSGAQKRLAKAGGDVNAAILETKAKAKKMRDGGENSYAAILEDELRVLDQYKESGKLALGRMYEVDIDATPDEFLDYDVPLSEQSDFIKQNPSIKELIKGDAEYNKRYPSSPIGERHGGNVLTTVDESDLASSGIKGIRYKDAFSRDSQYEIKLSTRKGSYETEPLKYGTRAEAERAAESYRGKGFEANIEKSGTSNYVIFDDRLISIAKKYGIAIPAAAALLSQETGLNPSSLYEEENPV